MLEPTAQTLGVLSRFFSDPQRLLLDNRHAVLWLTHYFPNESPTAIAGKLNFIDFKQKFLLQQAINRYLPFDIRYPPQGNTRLEQSLAGGREKQASIHPEQEFVLAKQHDGHLRLAQQTLSLAAQQSLRCHLSQLPSLQQGVVIIIENLDIFDHWQSALLPPVLSNALTLYRGHNSISKAVKQLVRQLPAEVLLVLFTDIDPAGLKIAHEFQRLHPHCALLQPAVWPDRLLQRNQPDVFIKQHLSHTYLQKQALQQWAPLWHKIHTEKLALMQQDIFSCRIPLQLCHYALPQPN